MLRNWGWTLEESKNEKIIKELGDGIASEIFKQSKKQYTSEKGAELYAAAGCTDDWMAAKGNMTSLTIELRDTGRYGFGAPTSEIVPTGEEIWSAMRYFVSFVIERNIPPNEYLSKATANQDVVVDDDFRDLQDVTSASDDDSDADPDYVPSEDESDVEVSYGKRRGKGTQQEPAKRRMGSLVYGA